MYKTEQELFWAGEFGADYIARNDSAELVAANLDLFAKALRHARQPASCLEFGANIGMNLRALKLLHPSQEQFGIEINPQAAVRLAQTIPAGNVFNQSILEFEPTRTFDLVLIKGVLIHINPDALPAVYDKLHQATGKHMLVAEYYNPVPVALDYRGHTQKLFKRDFAGEIMDRHPDLVLVDYGFAYHRDPNFAHGDVSWFLMEKRG